MKRGELFELYDKLQGLRSYSDNKKFSYALIKNIKLIEEEIKIQNDLIKPSKRFQDFEQERINICQSHAVRDENNKPILNGNEYQIKDMEIFNSALIPIKEKYNDILIERQAQIEKYNIMLDENINIDLVKVGVDDLPDGITPNELEDIYPILL